MEISLLLEKCRRHASSLDVFRDKAGTAGIGLFVDGTFHFFVGTDAVDVVQGLASSEQPLACFDSRRLLGTFPSLAKRTKLYDVKLLYGGDSSLFRIGREQLGSDQVVELQRWDRRFGFHLRACKTAKVDLDRHSVMRLVPAKIVLTLCRLRTMAINALWEKKSLEDPAALEQYERETWPFALDLYEVEKAGIKVDVPFVKQSLRSSHGVATDKLFQSIDGTAKDGYVYSQFSPVGVKTGRARVEGGFNAMGIPHGEARKAIVSRFEDGTICAFDFNAIDYHCIVSSVGDESFREKYDGVDDFHTRTASFLFGENVDELRRDVVKQITYVYIYGGSEDTLSKKTGLSLPRIRDVLSRLEEKMRPIRDFKDELFSRSIRQRYVELPNGRRIELLPDDHPGKVLGLYAQGYSAWVFQRALAATMKKTAGWSSKVIFTVHDEIVMDMHPYEQDRDVQIQDQMELAAGDQGARFAVKFKHGKNYAEASV